MKLHVIDTGFFKLDGGAMFGVVPKVMWQKFYPADADNLCTWAMRCLLIEEANRLILIDTGLGGKQSEKFFANYQPHGDASLLTSIQKAGYSADDVTDVILTHLHFDHCGGAITGNAENGYRPAFKNAVYWSHSAHWQWAVKPNAREKASFLKENILPIEESGQLKFLDKADFAMAEIKFHIMNGHTEAMVLPEVKYKEHSIVYCADLLPSPHHVPLPYVMAYDVRPLQTLSEKAVFLGEAVAQKKIMFFEHDRSIECCRLLESEKGIRPTEGFLLKDL